MDPVLPGVPVPHAAREVQRRVQLDGDVPARQRHRGAVRALGVLRRARAPEAAGGHELRGQQDEEGGVVRVQLRRAQQAPAVRAPAAEAHPGRHLRRLRHQEVPALQRQQMSRNARQGLQVLLGFRELEL